LSDILVSTLTEVGFVEAQQTLREPDRAGKVRTETNNRVSVAD